MITFIKTMYRWLTGTRMLPKQMIVKRYNVCKFCDEKQQGWIREYCRECGCTISKRRYTLNKLAHPCQECPLGKWSKVTGYNCE